MTNKLFLPDVEKRVSALERAKYSAAKVVYSEEALTGEVGCCAVVGVNGTNGDFYYRNDDGEWELAPVSGGGGGGLQSIGEGNNITVDNTDSDNPVIGLTPFTNRSVPYANVSGVLIEDNTGLFYDGTNLTVGHNDANQFNGININAGRGKILAALQGLIIQSGVATSPNYDSSKHTKFQNGNNTPYLDLYSVGDSPGPYTHWADFTTNVRIFPLDTDGTAPTTSGTTKMVVTDGNGQLSFTDLPNESDAYSRLGATNPIIGESPVGSIFNIHNGTALVSQTVKYTLIEVKKSTTATGVKFWTGTPGAYTASNYNGIGLYSLNLGTGALTLIASSTDDGNLWKGSTSLVTKAFTTPVSVPKGFYVVAGMYSSSAQTTAPIIGHYWGFASTNMSAMDFPNGIKLSSTLAAQTALTTPIAFSSLASNATTAYFGLY